jgi:hypothetical protein
MILNLRLDALTNYPKKLNQWKWDRKYIYFNTNPNMSPLNNLRYIHLLLSLRDPRWYGFLKVINLLCRVTPSTGKNGCMIVDAPNHMTEGNEMFFDFRSLGALYNTIFADNS